MTKIKFVGTMYNVLCGECGEPMVLRKSKRYPAPFWGCSQYPKCTGTHGAHPNGRPLGVPANKETREWRIKAHAEFDLIWQTRKHGVRRKEAYRMLALTMGVERVHIGESDIETCKVIILNSKLILKMIKEWLESGAKNRPFQIKQELQAALLHQPQKETP